MLLKGCFQQQVQAVPPVVPVWKFDPAADDSLTVFGSSWIQGNQQVVDVNNNMVWPRECLINRDLQDWFASGTATVLGEDTFSVQNAADGVSAGESGGNLISVTTGSSVRLYVEMRLETDATGNLDFGTRRFTGAGFDDNYTLNQALIYNQWVVFDVGTHPWQDVGAGNIELRKVNQNASQVLTVRVRYLRVHRMPSEDANFDMPGTAAGYAPAVTYERGRPSQYARGNLCPQSQDLTLLTRGANTTVTKSAAELNPEGVADGYVHRLYMPDQSGTFLDLMSGEAITNGVRHFMAVWIKQTTALNRNVVLDFKDSDTKQETALSTWRRVDLTSIGRPDRVYLNNPSGEITDIFIWRPHACRMPNADTSDGADLWTGGTATGNEATAYKNKARLVCHSADFATPINAWNVGAVVGVLNAAGSLPTGWTHNLSDQYVEVISFSDTKIRIRINRAAVGFEATFDLRMATNLSVTAGQRGTFQIRFEQHAVSGFAVTPKLFTTGSGDAGVDLTLKTTDPLTPYRFDHVFTTTSATVTMCLRWVVPANEAWDQEFTIECPMAAETAVDNLLLPWIPANGTLVTLPGQLLGSATIPTIDGVPMSYVMGFATGGSSATNRNLTAVLNSQASADDHLQAFLNSSGDLITDFLVGGAGGNRNAGACSLGDSHVEVATWDANRRVSFDGFTTAEASMPFPPKLIDTLNVNANATGQITNQLGKIELLEVYNVAFSAAEAEARSIP